jgi:hypothetical protein
MKLTIEIEETVFDFEVADSKAGAFMDVIYDKTADYIEANESAETLEDVCEGTGLDYKLVLQRLSHLSKQHLDAII